MTKEYEKLKKNVLEGTQRAVDKLIAEKERKGEKLVFSDDSEPEKKEKTTSEIK